MNIEKNRLLIMKLHEQIWNEGNLDILEEVYSPEFTAHYPMENWRGIDGVKMAVINIRMAFPDWHEEIEDIIIAEDKVVTRFRSSGTNLGEFLGILPTGKRVTIEEMAIFRINKGKVIEQWGAIDLYGLYHQLGVEIFHQSKNL